MNTVSNIFGLDTNLEISLVENRLMTTLPSIFQNSASHAIKTLLLKNYLLCKSLYSTVIIHFK